MSTTYYVVPAGRAFDTSFPDWPSLAMAERAIADDAADGIDYGVFAVEMVAGSRKTPWGSMVRHRGGREITTYRDPAGEWVAYDDNYGVEASSLYGHGRTEEEATAECLDVLADYEAEVAAKRAALAEAA